MAFPYPTQVINQEKANIQITGGETGSGQGTGRTNKQIVLRMFYLDWMFQWSDGSPANIADLVMIIKNAPEKVMDTTLVKNLVTYFYAEQKSTVIKFGFVPYVIYLISILYVFIGRLTNEASNSSYDTVTSVVVYGIAVITTCYFAYLEVRQA